MTGAKREEFEERTILAIDSTKKKLTLNVPLLYNHFAGSISKGNETYQLRAKVAVFTRQIVIQGDEESIKS